MSEQNKAIVSQAIEEIWNKGNLNIIGEIISAGFVSHHPRNRDEDIHGIEEYKNRIAKIRGACTDIKVDVLNLFAESDKVICHVRGKATYKGKIETLGPAGKQITTTATAMIRMVDGKIAECWAILDSLGMMQQLGIIAPLG